MSPSPLLQLDSVERHYYMGDQRVAALDGVSFTVQSGELMAIIGSSGSGKSTLLNVLGCLDTPTAGSYRLHGRDVQELSDDERADLRNREIGFIFQNFQLLPRTAAIKNVELPLVYRRVPRKERRDRAREALERVGLGDRLEHRPNELSGGQRQRVAIARALVASPSLLLADEPTGNLDSSTGAEILALFDQLHDDGNTVLIVTHEAEVAERCARAVRIQDGRVVGDGPGAEVAHMSPRAAAELAGASR